MNFRRGFFIISVLAIVAWFFRSEIFEKIEPFLPHHRKLAEAAVHPAFHSSTAPNVPANFPETRARSELADQLNAPSGDIGADLRILEVVFDAFRSNFPHAGNPVGDNRDITAVLTGKNALRLALIPRDLPAISAEGELCDRWGRPFFFHQLGATRMEIRSSGPDRKLWTEDDVVLTP